MIKINWREIRSNPGSYSGRCGNACLFIANQKGEGFRLKTKLPGLGRICYCVSLDAADKKATEVLNQWLVDIGVSYANTGQ